jgi:hypothetical protein
MELTRKPCPCASILTILLISRRQQQALALNPTLKNVKFLESESVAAVHI